MYCSEIYVVVHKKKCNEFFQGINRPPPLSNIKKNRKETGLNLNINMFCPLYICYFNLIYADFKTDKRL